jgi:hypothetical protein
MRSRARWGRARLGVWFGAFLASGAILACDGSGSTGPAGPSGVAGESMPDVRDGELTGVLTLTRVEPLEAAMVNVDLGTQRLVSPAQIAGVNGTRNVEGEFAFVQECGAGWGVFIADASGTPVDTVFECADRGGAFQDYSTVQLSPDGTRVAVVESPLLRSPAGALVVSRTGQELAFFEGFGNPSWTVDGRLLVVRDGLWMTDASLAGLARIDQDQILGAMGTAAAHPDGERVAFEYVGAIYQMHLDGSGFARMHEETELAYSPVWSPDGNVLAFLLSDGTSPERAVFFHDFAEGTTSTLWLNTFLDGNPFSTEPQGPLSWRDL